MRYRKLSQDHTDAEGNFVRGGDMTFGQGLSDFYIDQAEAVGQAVVTRLRLQQGDWFLDRREGTPWKTRVLGHRTTSTRDPVIKHRVLATQGVTEITDYFSDLNRDSREFAAQIGIDTIYGKTVVEGPL
jgi:hypothetical protein